MKSRPSFSPRRRVCVMEKARKHLDNCANTQTKETGEKKKKNIKKNQKGSSFLVFISHVSVTRDNLISVLLPKFLLWSSIFQYFAFHSLSFLCSLYCTQFQYSFDKCFLFFHLPRLFTRDKLTASVPPHIFYGLRCLQSLSFAFLFFFPFARFTSRSLRLFFVFSYYLFINNTIHDSRSIVLLLSTRERAQKTPHNCSIMKNLFCFFVRISAQVSNSVSNQITTNQERSLFHIQNRSRKDLVLTTRPLRTSTLLDRYQDIIYLQRSETKLVQETSLYDL